MKIVWVIRRDLDVALDKATWVEMVKNLTLLGHEVKLIASFKNKEAELLPKDNLCYISSGTVPYLKWLMFNARLMFKLTVINKNFKPDAIIFFPSAYYIGILYSILRKLGLFKAAIFLDVRTLTVVEKQRKMRGRLIVLDFSVGLRLCSRYFDGITYITPFMEEYLSSKYKLRRMAENIWSSGVDLDFFDPDKKYPIDDDLASRLKGKFVVIYHGVVHRNRKIVNIALAVLKLKEMGCKDVAALIVGDGEGMDEIRGVVGREGLSEDVFLAGAVDYALIPGYISLADAGILPFSNDLVWRTSSAIKFLEYLAMRKPTIGVKMEAFTDVVHDSSVCFWAASNSPEHLAQAILTAKNTDKPGLLRMGKDAREIAARYTWQAQAERLVNFLARQVRIAGEGSEAGKIDRSAGLHGPEARNR